MITLQVPATDVRVGDVVGCSEIDYVVRTIRRVNHDGIPADVRKLGGWIDLTGDSEDGYFQRHYGGEESYYALPTEMIDIQRNDQ